MRVGAGSGFYKNPYPTRTRFGFFFKNPNPTLFLIGSGKIRPIRVGPDRVPADRVKIAIPSDTYNYSSMIYIIHVWTLDPVLFNL